VYPEDLGGVCVAQKFIELLSDSRKIQMIAKSQKQKNAVFREI